MGGNAKALRACTESAGARAVLKALPYTTSEEAKTDLLFEQVVQLPAGTGKEKKREWTGGLMAHEKQKLKARAKVLQKEELAKLASGWLQQGPKKSETRRASLPEKKKKKEAPKSAPKEGADEEEDESAPQEEDEDED